MTNSKRKVLSKLANERTGETRINVHGSAMTIDKYNGANDIWVRFVDSNYLVHTNYNCFINGGVKNPFDKSVYGVGYIGVGQYKVSDQNGKQTPQYSTWRRILERAYSAKYHETKPTYKDVKVCKEWHNFQMFASWYDNNYYTIYGQDMDLDKDILIKGNKIYSPETCVFVPQRINTLFNKRAAARGDLPIGVSWVESMGKYKAACSYGNGFYLTQLFNDPIEAFECYKKMKENRIKEVADKYKDCIPANLYEAMLAYKVEITD